MTTATPTLRLDKSKPYSTIHGDRTPEDPHYHVHYFQDTLPFDSDGLLVPDDKKEQPWREARVEEATGAVRHILHYPLYNAEMRAKLARKLERLAGNKAAPTADFDPTDDINLEAWLRAEVEYESHEIYAAVLKRAKKKVFRLGDAVEALVYEEKVLPEADVAPSRMTLMDRRAA